MPRAEGGKPNQKKNPHASLAEMSTLTTTSTAEGNQGSERETQNRSEDSRREIRWEGKRASEVAEVDSLWPCSRRRAGLWEVVAGSLRRPLPFVILLMSTASTCAACNVYIYSGSGGRTTEHGITIRFWCVFRSFEWWIRISRRSWVLYNMCIMDGPSRFMFASSPTLNASSFEI